MCFKKLFKKWQFNRFVKKQVKELNERISIDPSLRKMSDEIWGELDHKNTTSKANAKQKGEIKAMYGCLPAKFKNKEPKQ